MLRSSEAALWFHLPYLHPLPDTARAQSGTTLCFLKIRTRNLEETGALFHGFLIATRQPPPGCQAAFSSVSAFSRPVLSRMRSPHSKTTRALPTIAGSGLPTNPKVRSQRRPEPGSMLPLNFGHADEKMGEVASTRGFAAQYRPRRRFLALRPPPPDGGCPPLDGPLEG